MLCYVISIRFAFERDSNSGPGKGIQNEITKRPLYLCAISPRSVGLRFHLLESPELLGSPEP